MARVSRTTLRLPTSEIWTSPPASSSRTMFDTVAAASPVPRASPACVISPMFGEQLEHPHPVGAAQGRLGSGAVVAVDN